MVGRVMRQELEARGWGTLTAAEAAPGTLCRCLGDGADLFLSFLKFPIFL